MDLTPPPIDDGFTAEKLFNQGFSYTYDDVIFLPNYIDFPADDVNLSTKLSRNLNLSVPLGGIAIIHSNTTAAAQASLVRAAKSRRFPVLHNPVFLPPSAEITSADDFADSPFILVTESGNPKPSLLGYVSRQNWINSQANRNDKGSSRVHDYLVEAPVTVPWSYDLAKIDKTLNEKKANSVGLVTEDDVVRAKGYPKVLAKGSVGANGEWLVGPRSERGRRIRRDWSNW